MTHLSRIKKQQKLENILNHILAEGDYEAALLADSDGLPLAIATNQTAMGEMMAAMTALLQDAASEVRNRLKLAYVNELSLVGDDRFRLVCRFFQVDRDEPLSLTVVVPPDQAYRRITNNAINRIQTAWAE